MALKVFISFKTEDEALAEALYLGLTEAGALVYQFRKTATPGTSAWGVVCNSISDSDVFVVFLSRRSLKSRPVAAEGQGLHFAGGAAGCGVWVVVVPRPSNRSLARRREAGARHST